MINHNYTVEAIVKIVRGELISPPGDGVKVNDILIDSRRLISAANCLFFAIISKTNDGHKYIQELYGKGVRSFVVSTRLKPSEYPGANIIWVKDTLAALQMLAAWHRKQFAIPVIGITGSNGKTIVKEWLYQLLGEDKKIIRSPKSYNSQIGVPLSVWQMKQEHELAIFEAGISEPDEMNRLQPIIMPTIGIFTNIGQAHAENFIHQSQKIAEKLKLFTKVDRLFYSSDYPEIKERIVQSENLKTIPAFTWSKKGDADLKVTAISKNQQKTNILGIYKDAEINIEIPYTDDASIENAIICWAVMLSMGYPNEIIARRMLLLNPVAMRLELKEGINNCSVINDSYNCDINSLGIALDFLNQQKQHKKKTVILSDILQSGLTHSELYGEVARLLREKGIARVIGIGKDITKQADKFDIEKSFFASTDEFLQDTRLSEFSSETILLKGARIFELEKISALLQQKTHETVLEINLNALINNLNYYRKLTASHTKIMAMVKAFSYGSGSFEIANLLQYHNIDYLAVAYTDEGVELRKSGITVPIMVMNPEEQSFEAMMRFGLEPEIYSFRILDALENAIEMNTLAEKKQVNIHLKFDTGMHRLGFEENDVPELLRRIERNLLLKVQSVFTHLAASEDELFDKFTQNQIDRFKAIALQIEGGLGYHPLNHVLNSAGISRFRDAHFDMVRLGIGLYGVSDDPAEQELLQNVTTLRTTISQTKLVTAGESVSYGRTFMAEKNMTLAILPIGYADGLNRKLSNGRGKVFVNGKLAPIIGKICMDMCMIDISNIPAREGDRVIIFGNEHPIANIANAMETIPYEVLTSVSRRVKRIYYQE